MHNSFIYHITTQAEWQSALQDGWYAAASLPIEGFIHCATLEQVSGVLQRYFAGKTDLVQLTIDVQLLVHPLQYELAPSVNDHFPHIYGPINTNAVTSAVAL